MIGHVRLIRQHNLARLSTKRGEEMSDALARLALEAPTDAAARRIFEGGERDARDDPAARPRLLDHEPHEHDQAARMSHRYRRRWRRRRRKALFVLVVLAALAVAYLLTTGRVPMILV